MTEDSHSRIGGSDVVTCLLIIIIVLFLEYRSQHDAVTTGDTLLFAVRVAGGTLGHFAFSSVHGQLGPPGCNVVAIIYGKHTLHNVILILSAESLVSHERSRAKGGATSWSQYIRTLATVLG